MPNRVETLACWPFGRRDWCEATATGTFTELGAAGWAIGIYDGQGYYVCGEYHDGVDEAFPLHD